MTMAEDAAPVSLGTPAPDHLERRLKDYAESSSKLLLQRQAIFIAVLILGATYFDPWRTFACYGAVLMTELLDIMLNWRVNRWKDHNPAKARLYQIWVIVNTLLSALAISFFIIAIAAQQRGGGHFTPLFFLFAASLFAAMNNHQLMPALALRLTIYAATFLTVSLMDILPEPPPLSAAPWLQFFTTMFVLYFLLDTSMVFLRLYRKGLKQLDDLRAQHEQTLQAYEVKSKFLSTVSHELRTPLTSIKASVDLINTGVMGEVPEKIQPILQIAGKNSKRLSDLINDLLDVQRIEAGEMVYHFATVNVRHLVEELVEANQSFGQNLGVGIEAEFPEADALIEGDEARLMQVMANLLSNAIKFSAKGSNVVVRVGRKGRMVRISVRDCGVGIEKSARDLVFGKFTQVDSSDQRRVGGTGLGMHISEQIIEKHNGRIDFTSEPGKGTTFFIELRELPAGAASAPVGAAPSPATAPAKPARPPRAASPARR